MSRDVCVHGLLLQDGPCEDCVHPVVDGVAPLYGHELNLMAQRDFYKRRAAAWKRLAKREYAGHPLDVLDSFLRRIADLEAELATERDRAAETIERLRREREPACPCAQGHPEEWEGPLRECPIHGEKK